MLSLAVATSTAELFSAMTATAAGDEDAGEQEADERPKLAEAAWSLLARCCDADVASLPGTMDSERAYWPYGAAIAAIQARRDLLYTVSDHARAQILLC